MYNGGGASRAAPVAQQMCRDRGYTGNNISRYFGSGQ